ncbi:hypothetical protein SAMN05216357_102252 [Porphyromonadaceae bacterium KH3CP3RA]|nr:hypothetical protein SAMN05216357_102252 [Porphyromonadaceae bacterium KH3CP3RA]
MITMKKLLYISYLALVFAGCSQDDDLSSVTRDDWNAIKSRYGTYQQRCGSVSDGIQYPANWTIKDAEAFVVSDETIRSMSTCGLLDTYLTHPERVLGPWCEVCSYSLHPGVTEFNNMVNNDKILKEIFGRNNCVEVLASRYLSMIEQGEEVIGRKKCLEMIIASDACISLLKEEERVQFMMMALKMMNREKKLLKEPRHILVAIMKAGNYTPFLTEASKDGKYSAFKTEDGVGDPQRNGLSENTWGYDICVYDVVEKYAKRFLNDLKR